jgi:hypothetical protein
MSMKINNRVLGIDSKDVMKCEDLEVLNEWRMNIAMQRSDVLFNNSVTREADLPSGEKKKMLFLRRFESIIYRRITEIKERTRMERKEAQALAFQKACKRILPKWQYDVILEKSKEVQDVVSE